MTNQFSLLLSLLRIVVPDRCCCKRRFHFLESRFLFVTPLEVLSVAFCEFGSRGSGRIEVFDELSVKVGEANKNLKITNAVWTFRITSRLHLGKLQ